MKVDFFLNVNGERKLVKVDKDDIMTAYKRTICGCLYKDEADGFMGLAINELAYLGVYNEGMAEALAYQMKKYAHDEVKKILDI